MTMGPAPMIRIDLMSVRLGMRVRFRARRTGRCACAGQSDGERYRSGLGAAYIVWFGGDGTPPDHTIGGFGHRDPLTSRPAEDLLTQGEPPRHRRRSARQAHRHQRRRNSMGTENATDGTRARRLPKAFTKARAKRNTRSRSRRARTLKKGRGTFRGTLEVFGREGCGGEAGGVSA